MTIADDIRMKIAEIEDEISDIEVEGGTDDELGALLIRKQELEEELEELEN